MALLRYLPIITLNVHGLNAPTKRHMVAESITKQDLYIYNISTKIDYKTKAIVRDKDTP